jgi:hypothetical protein
MEKNRRNGKAQLLFGQKGQCLVLASGADVARRTLRMMASPNWYTADASPASWIWRT